MSLHCESINRLNNKGIPFIGRVKELGIIQEKLDGRRKNKPLSLPVTCFYGEFGSGKTSLLYEIKRRYENQALNSATPTIATYVDFADPNIYHPSELKTNKRVNRRALLLQIWEQCFQQDPDHFTQIKDADIIPEDTLAKELVTQIHAAQSHLTPVLLFDSTEELENSDKDAFLWLEELLVAPVVKPNAREKQTEGTLFVFAGRKELIKWRKLRREVDLIPLNSFNKQEAATQIGASDEINALIFNLTAGHPYFTHRVLQALKSSGIDLTTSPLEEVEQSLQQILKGELIQKIADEVLDEVPDNLKDIALYASVLRQLNTDSLQTLAVSLGLTTSNIPWIFYQDEIIVKLQEHNLLRLDINIHRYFFPRGIRHILSHELQATHEDGFLQAHLAAYRFYFNHLSQYPQYLSHYLPELIYHRSILEESGFAIPNEFKLTTGFIKSYFDEYMSKNIFPEIGLRPLLDELYQPSIHGMTPPKNVSSDQISYAAELQRVASEEYKQPTSLRSGF